MVTLFLAYKTLLLTNFNRAKMRVVLFLGQKTKAKVLVIFKFILILPNKIMKTEIFTITYRKICVLNEVIR